MIYFLLFSILISLIDCLIKFWVIKNIGFLGQIETIFPFLKITSIKNYGVAFGILKNHVWLVLILTFLILLALIYLILSKKIKDTTMILAISFIVGGGIGNLIDRLFFGYVIDYLKLTFFPMICNLSDYFICIGAVLMCFYYLKNSKNN